ncbi:hypothetical protein CPB86DRAFT_337923 [Serendipita vermifera]|nr:hypothetical protein CPB86DRAFT_337923 [Serendipita vermifera]
MSCSVKQTDKTKIGKYGLGFRSCYHITDTPQIISGKLFAIFDPHQTHLGDKIGVMKDFTIDNNMGDHLAAFDDFIQEREIPFNGAIIRLPLRTNKAAQTSKLVQKPSTIEDIEEIFTKFIEKELRVVLLFLSNLSSIELRIRDSNGHKPLAIVQIDRENGIKLDDNNIYTKSVVTVTKEDDGTSTQNAWNMFYGSVPEDKVAKALGQKLDRDVETTELSKEKMFPRVSLAFPVNSPNSANHNPYRMGLFTFLPLPIPTDFPCHIHAPFALTSDRQKLLNPHDERLPKSRDKLLIEWNEFIFDDLVPSLWSRAVSSLLEHNPDIDPWSLWPIPEKIVSDVYWNSLPSILFRKCIQTGSAVWPLVVIPADQRPTYTSLATQPTRFSCFKGAFIVSADIEMAQIFSIVAAGVNVVQPPKHIFNALREFEHSVKVISPPVLREYLESNLEPVQHLSGIARQHLLSYLLSTGKLECIINIPIISQVNGDYTALQRAQPGHLSHILLKEEEWAVFRDLDISAIRMSSIQRHRELFEQLGPTVLNIKILDTQLIITYLESMLCLQDSEAGFSSLIQRIFEFWCWLASSKHFSAVVLSARSLGLRTIVTRDGELVPIGSSVFRTDEIDETLLNDLEQIGLKFIHAAFPRNVPSLLDSTTFLSPFDVASILDNIDGDRTTHLSDRLVLTLRDHLKKYLPSATLSRAQQQIALKLPIYNRLYPVTESSISQVSNVAKSPLSLSRSIRCVSEAIPLPEISDILFVNKIDYEIVKHFGAKHLNDVKALHLAIDALPQQGRATVRILVEYIKEKQRYIPVSVLERLENTPFVFAGDSRIAAPINLIDPMCEAAPLYSRDDPHVPQDDSIINNALHALGAFKTTLDPEMVKERIQFISESNLPTRHDSAMQLFRLIETSSFDISKLEVDSGLEWVPSEDMKVVRPSECYDPAEHPLSLFNRVARAVHPSLNISPPLRKLLRWNAPLKLDVVLNQFKAVILEKTDEEQKRQDLLVIIQKLGGRVSELDVEQLKDLCSLCSIHSSIPVLPKGCVNTTLSFFETPFAVNSAIPLFTVDPGIKSAKEFLQEIGCRERPSTDDVLSCFEGMPIDSQASNIDAVLELLHSMCRSEMPLKPPQRKRVRVPDQDGILRMASMVYHNDMPNGESWNIDVSNLFPAHLNVTDRMAKVIGIPFLSSFRLQSLSVDEDEDMGADLTTTIRGVLQQYNMEQAFTEFLANAEDAGAEHFAMVLDERYSLASERLLTKSMNAHQNEALVMFNDSVFKEKDFKGICRIGLGGKRENNDPIGRFGLGSLSMFHFTEVAMIISGRYVLFLDPTRHNITRDHHRASLRFPLKNIWRHYPDHLMPLEGKFGFSRENIDFFNGTLFRLALRSREVASKTTILENTLDPSVVKGLLKDTFYHAARESLLFLNLGMIQAQIHMVHDSKDLWTIKSLRRDSHTGLEEKGEHVDILIHEESMQIKEEWYIVTSNLLRGHLPQEFTNLIDLYRIPSVIKTGIAAYLSNGHPDSSTHQQFLYSTLPLPIPISLPVHLNAPFILAPDRRSIRFDGIGQLNLESQYNHWLLTQLVPPLYCRLLQDIPKDSQLSMWPGDSGTRDEDIFSISSLVTSAFFKHLPESKHMMCWTTTGHQLTPSSSRFAENLPDDIYNLLSLLPVEDTVLIYNRRIRARILGSGVRTIGHSDLFQILRENNDKMLDLFNSGDLKIDDIWSILQYLTVKNCTGAKLDDIRILPLGDKSLGYLSSRGPKVFFRGEYPRQFPKQRFVNRHIPLKLAQDLIMFGLNVVAFDGRALQGLVMERLPKSAQMELTEQKKRWVDSLWQLVDDDTKRSLDEFPVVPTSSHLSYISVEKALGETVLFCPSECDSGLIDSLVSAGAVCVYPASCHETLRTLLSGKRDLFFQILDLADKGLLQIPLLNTQSLHIFSRWIKSQITDFSLQKDDRDKACSLPIWTTFTKEDDERITGASNAYMLPDRLGMADVRPFLIPNVFFAEYSTALRRIIDNERVITVNTLNTFIGFPDAIDGSSMDSFKVILQLLIRGGGDNLLVPNGDGIITPLRNLYSGSVDIFATSLSTRRDLFLHPDLHELDPQLRNYGLRHQLDAEAFVACASAIHNDRLSDNIIRRGRALFGIYNTEFSIRIRNDPPSRRLLGDLSFIPRVNERRQGAPWGNSFCDDLPMVVSLNQALLREFEAIAWTQRARFDEEPNAILLAVEENLGKPSVLESVSHLCVLALRIAPEHPNDTLLINDLRETYRWLASDNCRQESSELISDQFADEPLFLNVDSGYSDTWQWHTAKQLVFNNGVTNEGRLRPVRNFLLPFKSWLVACGATEVQRPEIVQVELSSPMQILNRQREVYSRLRQTNSLCDVALVTYSDEEVLAHRVILAVASSKFEVQFTGDYEESAPLSGGLVRVATGFSLKSVQHCLSFIYSSTLDPNVDQDIETLLEVLGLADYWEVIDLHRTMQGELANLISLGTYTTIKQQAELYQAYDLKKACESFAEKNREIISQWQPDAE